MRATQRQLDSAAQSLAAATDTDKYKALLTVAVLAINEREDRSASEYEGLRKELIEKDHRIMELEMQNEQLEYNNSALTIQYEEIKNAKDN